MKINGPFSDSHRYSSTRSVQFPPGSNFLVQTRAKYSPENAVMVTYQVSCFLFLTFLLWRIELASGWDFSGIPIPNPDVGDSASGFFIFGQIKKSRKSHYSGNRQPKVPSEKWMKTSKNSLVKNPENPKIPGSGSRFENLEKSQKSQNHGDRDLFFGILYPGYSLDIPKRWRPRAKRPHNSEKSTFISSGFGIF